jgi:polar amino acid transport system substrate-binding protein
VTTRIADIAPTGALRAALVRIPFLAKDDAKGALIGVAPDLAAAMAGRLGVPLKPTAMDTPDEGIAAVRDGQADLTFLAPTPQRLAQIDFGPPFMALEATLLVPRGSAISTLSDADRPGRKIVAYERTAVEQILRARIRRAAIVTVPIFAHARGLTMLTNGEADALADLKHALTLYQRELPGSRIVTGSYGRTTLAIGYAKSYPAMAGFVKSFVEEARASGLILTSIASASVQGAVVPAAD